MTARGKIRGLIAGFAASVEQFGERPALVVGRDWLSYAELARRAASVATAVRKHEVDAGPIVALLAYRSVTAYAGVLGILAAGKGYAPLNPRFPIQRTRSMLIESGCSTMIVGAECISQLPELLVGINRRLTIISPDARLGSNRSADFRRHRLFFAADVPPTADLLSSVEVEADAVAYLLFTSGSTGVPKGVPVHHRNVRPYVEYVTNLYEVTPEDRFSQEFDLTFDLSIHDMFAAWERGACLFCVPETSVMAPAKFIREHELTMWFSVPSVIGMLTRMRLLSPNCFPSLRISLFCGEPLVADDAQLWQRAASNSILENLYGPTETTIAVTHYRWDVNHSTKRCRNAIVPIGRPFAGQKVCVIDGQRQRVPTGGVGELCVSGSQVTTGYWNNPEKTREQFVRLSETDETLWYRTGDLACQDDDGCLHYLGRLDHQVKIRGYRVELQEIEGVLRKLCGTEQVVSLPLESRNGSADGVVAFVCGASGLDLERIAEQCAQVLPEYMVPKRIYPIREFPLNLNGKIDRPQLAAMLAGMQV